jgi:hypothetical protein
MVRLQNYELLVFMLMGALGGIWGSAFVILHEKVVRWRQVTALGVSLTILAMFRNEQLHNCRDLCIAMLHIHPRQPTLKLAVFRSCFGPRLEVYRFFLEKRMR